MPGSLESHMGHGQPAVVGHAHGAAGLPEGAWEVLVGADGCASR